MNKKEELKDRLVDELLHEDARGGMSDEKLLLAVEAGIDGEAAADKVTPIRGHRSRAPYAWAAVATASAASVIGFLGWRASQGDGAAEDLALTHGSEIRTLGPQMDPAASRGVPRKQPIGRYSKLWSQSPHTTSSAAPMEASPAVDASAVRSTEESGRERQYQSRDDSRSAKPKPLPPGVIPTSRSGDGLPAGVNPGNSRSIVQGNVPLSVPTGPVSRESNSGRKADRKEKLAAESEMDAGWGTRGNRHAPPVSRENYGQLVEQPWKATRQGEFSTFSVDVDTASYTNVRRMLQQGVRVPADAVRIEECINYFDYRYEPPTAGGPFAVHVDMATCPWAEDHRLMKVGLKGMEVPTDERPASNLVFLIDVSGSMQGSAKLPLLVESMKVLVEELDERDRVGIVVYAGSQGVVLEPTHVTEDGRGKVLEALNRLRAGGSTNGGAGIQRAYSMAQECFVEGGTNRVILATDGDFNVGTTGQGDLVTMVKERAKSGVFLSVLGFGTGNINDSMLEAITNDGNGNYFYIDSQEGRKVFLNDLSGTLVTIAKDVKIQIDFNRGKVQAYRLIGYANRILRDEDFNNDKVDAGDIGAGHTVTALYEIVPVGAPSPAIGGVEPSKYDKPAPAAEVVDSDEWMTVRLRYKRPDGDKSTKMEVPVAGEPSDWEAADGDFQFAAGVALFGMKLRQSEYANDAGWDLVRTLARKGSTHDIHGYRAEFMTLVEKAAGGTTPPRPRPAVEAPRAE